jgi:hypothetical protein
MGHLYVFLVDGKEVRTIRYIANAHFEAVSAIAECGLGNDG